MTSGTKRNNPSFGNSEKYFISDVFSKGNLIAYGVKSKLVFNELKFKKPLLFLFPSEEHYQKMRHIFEFEIKGFFEYVGGKQAGEIHIPRGYTSNARKLYYASSWNECSIDILPDEIFLKRYLNEKEGITKANITFSLTENKIVNPWGSITKSFTGEVSPELEPRITLDFNDAWKATIEEHYNFVDTKIDDVEGYFSSSQLVLTLEKANHRLFSMDEVKTISRWVDNMLLYLSFGSRQRTTWVKWSAIINNEYIEYFRNNVSIPQTLNNEEPLIDESSFQEFLTHCLYFSNQKENLDLYLPIIYLIGTGRQGKTIESQFLSLFMSLEALLDLYGEKNNKNKHLTNKTKPKWKDFYDCLTKAINDIPEMENELKETFIKRLGSLNKTSKRSLYEDFCQEYAIDNSDLWPIYGNNKFDLDKIRNDLVHGRRTQYDSILDIATENLRWIIERCILAVLGWKGKTDVNKDSLWQYTAYEWKNYIEKNNANTV